MSENWWDVAPVADAAEDWWSAAPIAGEAADQPQAMTEGPSFTEALMGALAPQPDTSPQAIPARPRPIDEMSPPNAGLPPALPDPAEVDLSSAGGDLAAAWAQAQQIIPGARAGLAIRDLQNGQQITGDVSQWPAMQMQVDAAAQAPRTLAEVLPGLMAKSDEIAAIPMNPAAQRLGQADTFREGLGAALDDPGGVLRTFGVRSLGTSVPTMLAAIGGSALGGPVGGGVAAGLTGAGTEAAMSAGSAIEAELRDAGIDVSSPDALAAYANGNPEAFDGIVRTALTRAGIIGAVDAATGGVTGGLARGAAASGRPGRIAATIGAGGAIEPAGEASGEALAQLATTGEIAPGEVLAEAIGGLATGAPTTAGQVAVEALRGAPNPATDIPPAPGAQSSEIVAPEIPTPPLDDLAAMLMPPAPVAPAQVAPPAGLPPALPEPVAPSTTPTVTAPAPQQVVPSPPAAALPSQDVVSTSPDGTHPGSIPQETNAQAPQPSPPSMPISAAPEVAPEEIAEPAPAQRKPLTYLVRRAGIQIDPDGPAGQELKSAGITSRTHPGLFRRGGDKDLDSIVASEHPELQQLLGAYGEDIYLPPQELLSAIIEEAQGIPRRGADQAEIAARRRDWTDLQAGLTQEAPRIDAPAEWTISDPEQDLANPDERAAYVTSAVDRVLAETGAASVVRPAERAAIIDRLTRSGGSIESAIDHEIVRSVLNAEAGREIDQDAGTRSPIPGWDDTGADEAPSAGGAERPGRDGVQSEGGAARDRPRGQARRGTEEGGSIDLTAEGAQRVIPGAEKITDREWAEREAEKPKRGGNAAPPAGGLFDDDARNQQSLFEKTEPAGRASSRPAETAARDGRTVSETETVEDAAPARRPGGRLSPRFLDFSFTNKQSVYGAAFRAAGEDPEAASNWPIERQIATVKRVLEARFGVKIEMPTSKVRAKNIVGRMVTKEKAQITTREALDQMLDAFRQMQMLASIMGVPERAMGLELDGEGITLSLVSTKRFGALGAFSWSTGARKITLPGRSNSFAHEWAHALDHYLGRNIDRRDFAGLLTREVDAKGLRHGMSPRGDLRVAFAGILKALFTNRAQIGALELQLQTEASQVRPDGKPTPAALQARKTMTEMAAGRRPPAEYLSIYFETSAEYDQMTGQKYFADPAEMFARAFEAWVGRTVGAVSDLPQGFLSKGPWAYDDLNDARLMMTFPKGSDAAAFAVAMSDLTHAMSRIALFPGAVADTPQNVDILSSNALLTRLPKTPVLTQEAIAWRESLATWKRIVGGGAKETVSEAGRLAHKLWDHSLTSLTAAVYGVARRQKDPTARQAIENIIGMIGSDPGSGRFTGRLWQQDVEMQSKRNLRKLDGALAKGWRTAKMTDGEAAELRALLTGQKVATDARVKTLAADLRKILNGIWYDLKDAGIEVSYQPTYLPRIYDKDAVADDTAGFERAASKVYGLMFDREVTQNDDLDAQREDMNAVIRGLRAARMPTPQGETEPASRLSQADEDQITAWRKARGKLRDLQRQAEKDSTSPTLGQRIADAENVEENLRAAVLDMLEKRFADYSAENWRTRMMVGASNDFDTMGPRASFLKGRTLPAEADQILAKYMPTHPVELISGYVYSAARRAEYAKRFGPGGEKLENMLAAAVKAGANGHDVSLVRSAVNAATGRMNGPPAAFQTVNGIIYALGTVSMLGRATFASLAEPMVAGLRSGDVRDSFRAVVSQVRALRSSNREDLFELARVIGLITSSVREGIMENRLGADSAQLTAGMSRMVSEFFQRSLLAPLTNFQQAANIPVAHGIIMRHLRTDRRGGSKFSDGELNELGIAKEDRADLLDWLETMDMPRPGDLLGPDGDFYNRAADLWSNAVVRLTNQTIQSPMKADRQIAANNPYYAALYGIMSFITAFHRQILVRNVRRIAKGEKASGKVGRASQVAAGIAMLFAGQFLATALREAIFNPEKWEEKDDEDELLDWLMERAFFRTGLTGLFDPLIQLGIGVRYERDLTAITAGPHLGYFLQNLQKIWTVIQGGRNSGGGNTAEWNATKAFYQLALQPGLMALATTLPGGPISTSLLSAPLIMGGSSPAASDAFATALTGEKGTKHKDRDDASTPWWEMGGKDDDE